MSVPKLRSAIEKPILNGNYHPETISRSLLIVQKFKYHNNNNNNPKFTKYETQT